MNEVTLLSSLGGTLGLWLGYSLLAVGEVVFSGPEICQRKYMYECSWSTD